MLLQRPFLALMAVGSWGFLKPKKLFALLRIDQSEHRLFRYTSLQDLPMFENIVFFCNIKLVWNIDLAQTRR